MTVQQMQVKGIFRELGVIRELGDQAITLKAAYRERKPKGQFFILNLIYLIIKSFFTSQKLATTLGYAYCD